MLKNVPKLISSDLLKALFDMGHGDEVAIVDANYPAETMGRRVIHYPGISATQLLDAILVLLPLDHIVKYPVAVMALEERDKQNGMAEPEIWKEGTEILRRHTGRKDKLYCEYSRNEFYEKSKEAYLIIQTGEERLYGNFLLKKGVIL